jgi:uncharacterized protein (DUF433 family)
MKKYQEYIVSDHRISLGKPIVKGTLISVEFILKKLSEGASFNDLMEQHKLSRIDIYAALDYASERLADNEELVNKK